MNGKQVDVYQWTSGKWELVGQAMGSKKEKTEYNGKMYDKVFSVEVEEGGQSLKLPVNFEEDPWEIAKKFCEVNVLPLSDLETTANFIIQNTPEEYKNLPKVPVVDMVEASGKPMDTSESNSSK